MSRVDFIAQPARRTTLDVIESVVTIDALRSMNVAAAYITASGLHDLLARLDGALGGIWPITNKRWITSFDYCRTQPVALEKLLSLPASAVRIHDAEFCLAHNAMPKIPFHPKAFLFRSTDRDFAIAGSGNLSRSGLSRGVEVGLALEVKRKQPSEKSAAKSVKLLRAWYSEVWDNSTPLNGAMLSRYAKIFGSQENLKNPTVTEDDLASDETTNGALTSKDLQKLRVCTHFWIDAGNITKNRGKSLPGNQLMMKRMSRVFFGFLSEAVPPDTFIGAVGISYGANQAEQYSLSYSNNSMDKLNLPIPGHIGPVGYDNQFLLFEQTAPQVFRVKLGTNADRAVWLKRSKAIEANFKMKSGREWGVF